MSFAQLGSGAESLRIGAEPATRAEQLQADLRSGALAAGLVVPAFLAQGFPDLVGYVDGLAADWRGFAGVRRWESAEAELVLEARHEFRQVQLRVLLTEAGPGWGNDGWQVRADLTVDPGEALPRFATQLHAVLD